MVGSPFRPVLALVGVLALLVLPACGDDDDDPATSGTSTTEPGIATAPKASGGHDVNVRVIVESVGTDTGFRFKNGKVSGSMGTGTASGDLVLKGTKGIVTMEMELSDGTATWRSEGTPQKDGSVQGDWSFTRGTGKYEQIRGGGQFTQRGDAVELSGTADY